MYDIIVIGAGPAGMMTAIMASSNGKKVLLIEKNDIVGKKLLLTGGTRCNLTNLKAIDKFIEEIPVNKRTLYSTLNNFGPEDIYQYFNNLNIPLKVEDNDRVFPKDNKATSIVNGLYNALLESNVDLHLNESVIEIKDKEITTNKDKYQPDKIIIATGGLSYSNTGSTGDGYKFAESMNQDVTKLYPAETYIITKDILPLEGISLKDVLVSFEKIKASGDILFTKKGLSGPAIFKISEYLYKYLENNKVAEITIDFIPNISLDKLSEELEKYNHQKEMYSFIKKYLPKRLGDYLVDQFIINQKIGSISKKDRIKLLTNIKAYKIDIVATGSIEQAFVTGGGVDIKNINTKTMESKINKDIYFAGEILDIHGHMGGYNITIALSTGYTAGVNAALNN